jgi:hypothetical protein
MKTLLGTGKYLLLVSILWAFALIVSYAQKQASAEKAGRVELVSPSAHLAAGGADAYPYIKIHPAVKLSPEDEKELTEKLAKFDTSLYRVVALSAGKVDEKRSIGNLKLSKGMETEMADAQAKGLSIFGPEFIPNGMQAAPAAAFRGRSDEIKNLMDAITPILSKYQAPSGQR